MTKQNQFVKEPQDHKKMIRYPKSKTQMSSFVRFGETELHVVSFYHSYSKIFLETIKTNFIPYVGLNNGRSL